MGNFNRKPKTSTRLVGLLFSFLLLVSMFVILYNLDIGVQAETSFPGDYTTLNPDGNISATPTLNHTYYWNPHSMNTSQDTGDLVLGNLTSWDIDYSGDYVVMNLTSGNSDWGHIATGPWYYTWNTSTGARQPLADTTIILSFDIRIVNVTYNPTSWLRIAMAVSFLDPLNSSGWSVKYVERDLYDNPIALNHSRGNAGHYGNIVYSQHDVIEYQDDQLGMGLWRHYDWNVSQYVNAGWGNISAAAQLEAAYCVIEVENVTHSEVNINNFWLRTVNSTGATQFNSWDSRVTRTEGSQNNKVQWVTVGKNGTDGYGVYANIAATQQNVSILTVADDHQDAYWSVTTSGTSNLTALVDSAFYMNGTDSLKVNGTRGSGTDNCYIEYNFLLASPLRHWTDYDFFIFFMYFNGSNFYYHRLQVLDSTWKMIEWEILDYFVNVTASGWSMVTLPIRRPSIGNSTAFNYDNVTKMMFWPDRADENKTETYGKNFTIWLDNEYLDKAVTAYATFNAPLDATMNVTIYGKKEITGWDSQYLPIISSSYVSNGTNYQLLRPTWIHQWAPLNPFTVSMSDAVAAGYSEYGPAYSGSMATVIGGESFQAVLVNGSAMGAYKKLVLRLKLAPSRTAYGLNNIDGDFGQEYTFGDLWELDIMVYFQTDMTFDWLSFQGGFEGCGDWVFVQERYYDFNLSVGQSAGLPGIDTVQLRFNTPTREGSIENLFLYHAGNWSVSFIPSNTTMVPTRTREGSALIPTDWDPGYFNFQIYFTADSLDMWQAAVDVHACINDTGGGSTGWILASALMFKIYSQGGFIMNSTTTGSAGIMDTSTPFSFWAENNSYVYRDLIYRDLIHVKMLPQISAIVGHQTFYVSYGVDYCLPGYDWVEGWKVLLGAESVTTGSQLYFNWTVSWWNRGSFVRQDTVRAFHHTNVPRGWYDPNNNYTTTTGLWIDLWFDRQNGSMVGGGRVNAYEYGMSDQVAPWLSLFSSAWGPIDNQTNSEQMFPLLDGDNVTQIPASQIKMVRIWSSLEVAAYTEEQTVVISAFPSWDLTFSQPFPPLTGISTPVFEQTTIPNMPSGGLLGALISGLSQNFKWISDNILYGGLSLWPMFVAFLDTIAAWLGVPNAFSNFMTWISGAWGGMASGMGWLTGPIVGGFQFLGIFMVQLLFFIALAFTYFGQVISGIFGFFTGTAAGATDLWTSLNLQQWLILGLILYPVWLIILWDEHGLDAVETELRRDWWVFSTIFGVLISIGRFILQVIMAVIESIPVVE